MRASFKLNAMAGFRKIPFIDVPEIPTERTLFPNSKTDFWYKVDIPLVNVTACIYELGPKGVFLPHIHPNNTEQIIPLEKSFNIEVVTDKYEKTVNYPESIYFDKNEPHAVKNLNDSVCVFLVLWSPKMIGWDALFLKKNENV